MNRTDRRLLNDLLAAIVVDDPKPLIEEAEYSARRAARLMHRSPAWVCAHAKELGGYREGERSRWRIPAHGIQAFQRRMALG